MLQRPSDKASQHPRTHLVVPRAINWQTETEPPPHKAVRHKNEIYLITLSDVNSTMWGSSISLGYQAACFRVREVELVKNLSAIGVVLK